MSLHDLFWGWCLFWCVVDAVVIFGLVVVAVLSSLPRRNVRWQNGDKRTPFRACPMCRHASKSSDEMPCRECLEGFSCWVAK